MPTCGSCHVEGQSIEHIRQCFGQRYTTVLVQDPVDASPILETYEQVKEAGDYQPMALATHVPDSKYAITTANGVLAFYEVKKGRGKWKSFTFLDHLVGAPGDWRRYPVKGASKKAILDALSQDPLGYARSFSMNFTICACCGSPLSDPESLSRGFGSICAQRFS